MTRIPLGAGDQIARPDLLPEAASWAQPQPLVPATEAELADLIRAADAPLRPVGGGTRLLPGEDGARLSTSALTGITLYEPAAMTLIARAGTPLAEVEALLATEGQMLAFEPLPRRGSTIGGVCAANASGPRRVQAGACRDAMLGIRMVDGNGAVIANGGRVVKNVTGYDLVKLMAGSRGRLGILTEIALKTAPIPPTCRTLRLTLGAAEAVPALTAALTGPFDVTGAAWLPDTGALIRLEGLAQSVALRVQALGAALSSFGTLADASDEVWLRLGQIPSGGAGVGAAGEGGDLWRILCRPSQAAQILAAVDPLCLDWGGALIVARLSKPPILPPGAIATRLTGGPGDVRLPPPDPVTARIEAGLRARFDPRGVLA